MTVPSNLTSTQVTGNGTPGPYSFNFPVSTAADLVVGLIDVNGLFDAQVNPTDYSVDVQARAITFTGNISNAYTIDMRRVTPETQATSIRNLSKYLPDVIEAVLDRIVCMVQDLNRRAYLYSLHGDDDDPASTPWPSLGSYVDRANGGSGTFPHFNGVTGLPELVDVPGDPAIAGSFTATISGMTVATTGTIKYLLFKNRVVLWADAAISGLSNSVACGISAGIPAALRPSAARLATCVILNAGGNNSAALNMTTSGTAPFQIGATLISNTGFTNDGLSKGIPAGWTVTYPL